MVQEAFDYLVLGEKWEEYDCFDCQIAHTCKFAWATHTHKKKLMIYDEIQEGSFKDNNWIPLSDFKIESFDGNDILTVDQIKNYFTSYASVDGIDKIDARINDSIRRLVTIKILNKDY